VIRLDEYDIEKAFKAIENELMASMIRNMKRHHMEEIEEGMQWSMWQVEQLKALEKYKQLNKEMFSSRFSDINSSITALVQNARANGNMQQEIQILNAIKNGWKPDAALKGSVKTMGEFFKLNDRKLEALIKATTNDMQKAESAILRMANDQYRQVIFNAQVYANTGAGTYEKAVDMATKDFMSRGLNCVEYANGARHTLAEYAFMAIQTASKRAYLTGEGEKRKEWGIATVIMNKRGNACPLCLPYVGKVMVDDVWSGGKSDGKHMLMSTAMKNGLYHPRCRDSHTTFFPGISSEGASYSRKDLKQIEDTYKSDQKDNYAKRQADKFKRLRDGALDEDNKKKYDVKYKEWAKQASTSKKKVNITDVAIDKIKDPGISEFSAAENAKIKQFHEELLRVAKDTNNSNEVLGMYTMDSDSMLTVLGDESSVLASANADARVFMMKAKDNSVIWSHNHPKGSTFSYEDINSFLNTKVKSMTIVTNKGKTFSLTKKNNFQLVELYDKIKELKKTAKGNVADEILKIIERYGVEYVR